MKFTKTLCGATAALTVLSSMAVTVQAETSEMLYGEEVFIMGDLSYRTLSDGTYSASNLHDVYFEDYGWDHLLINENVTDLVIPEEINGIKVTAVSDLICSNIKTITIPGSIKSLPAISYDRDGITVTDIYYGGSKEQWDEMCQYARDHFEGYVYGGIRWYNLCFLSDVVNVHYNSSASGAPSVTNKRGDINNDGKIDLNDITALLKNYVNGASDLTMDYNGDGKVDLADLTSLLSDYVNGKTK